MFAPPLLVASFHGLEETKRVPLGLPIFLRNERRLVEHFARRILHGRILLDARQRVRVRHARSGLHPRPSATHLVTTPVGFENISRVLVPTSLRDAEGQRLHEGEVAGIAFWRRLAVAVTSALFHVVGRAGQWRTFDGAAAGCCTERVVHVLAVADEAVAVGGIGEAASCQ
jgi:hypothetical protein